MASTGTMADYLAHMTLNASVNDGTFTNPTNVYLTLATAAITAGMNASAITEPTATWTNFARKQLAAGELDAAASRAKANGTAQSFGTATTTANTNCTHWAIVDSASGAGNMLWYGTLDGTIVVQNGNPVSVPIGSLKLAISTTLGTPP